MDVIDIRRKEGGELSFVIGRRGALLFDPPDVAQLQTPISSCVRGGIKGESVDLLSCLFGRFTRSDAQSTKQRNARYNLQSAC